MTREATAVAKLHSEYPTEGLPSVKSAEERVKDFVLAKQIEVNKYSVIRQDKRGEYADIVKVFEPKSPAAKKLLAENEAKFNLVPVKLKDGKLGYVKRGEENGMSVVHTSDYTAYALKKMSGQAHKLHAITAGAPKAAKPFALTQAAPTPLKFAPKPGEKKEAKPVDVRSFSNEGLNMLGIGKQIVHVRNPQKSFTPVEFYTAKDSVGHRILSKDKHLTPTTWNGRPGFVPNPQFRKAGAHLVG
ncbi:MAG: hypothetical protein U1F57_10625 [bacterium]